MTWGRPPPPPPPEDLAKWAAQDAKDAVKPSDAPQSAHGTEPPQSSGLEELILSALLDMNQSMREISGYLGCMARQMEASQEEPEQADSDEVPTRYLNGQRIS